MATNWGDKYKEEALNKIMGSGKNQYCFAFMPHMVK